MSRLIVVSNRVAMPSRGKPQAGGLAVAVNAALKHRSGIWFGWSGNVVDPPDSRPRLLTRGEITYAVTDLSTADLQEYYSGFANRVLWPILHYRVDLAEFTRSDLSGYIRVNETFANQISTILEPDDVIWVHDYHLMPLARYLRARGHTNKIGFFLHIPLPPPDILRALPHHAEIVGAMADYDVVGFQTENDRDNFARYLMVNGGTVSPDGNTYDVHGRSVSLGAFPVAIDTASYAKTARRASRSQFISTMKGSLGQSQLIMGVDRLDYSKGIGNRLDAFETFLEDNSDWLGRVSYLQITPKSRSDIPEYIEMDRMVSTRVGQINGTYGNVSWTPIRYINQTYSRTALAGLYRLARVALVTPLRDGMNLVAKEFVAAQDPEDPGALVLSHFAGAVSELRDGALVVNPHETEGMAAAIRRALEMPLEERKVRHARMMRALLANNIDCWAKSFLKALEDARPRATPVNNIRTLFAL
ncbi:alpha,alpha-trehalose-phosphate synthase (UDP-forming) [Chelatococcus reniformis]|uniref:Trehalose-6-phosphate synthase n=1 Tax=Chelatococcus reniformis TaxID=1494448 RepID=A0A916U174_9HYPH|nr:alpha,alpha-trehalose-phosphate synthase (UDP-forming) [Chelatococcus reniformis]GGC54648.1 alpha,alpha-trehalose-phosphate synthase (UDP-forming) [Chelatococcus reniformis]